MELSSAGRAVTVCAQGCWGRAGRAAGCVQGAQEGMWRSWAQACPASACGCPAALREHHPEGLGRAWLPCRSPLPVGEVGLVPAPSGEHKALLAIAAALPVRHQGQVGHPTARGVPARLPHSTPGGALGRDPRAHSLHQGRQPRGLLLPGVMLSRHVLEGKSKTITWVFVKTLPAAEGWINCPQQSCSSELSSTSAQGCFPTGRAQPAPHKHPVPLGSAAPRLAHTWEPLCHAMAPTKHSAIFGPHFLGSWPAGNTFAGCG